MDNSARAYFKSTALIPPLDFSAAGYTSDTDTADFSPFSLGPMSQSQEPGGDSDIKGPINGWATRYIGTQSTGGELTTRKAAYAGAHQSASFRDSSTRSIVNLTNSAYTGFPTAAPNMFWAGGGSNDSVSGLPSRQTSTGFSASTKILALITLASPIPPTSFGASHSFKICS